MRRGVCRILRLDETMQVKWARFVVPSFLLVLVALFCGCFLFVPEDVPTYWVLVAFAFNVFQFLPISGFVFRRQEVERLGVGVSPSQVVSDLGGEFAMIAVIGPGDRKLFQTRVVAFDVVQPRGVGGREDQSDAIVLRPFLDYLVLVGRKVVLDDIQALLHGISSSEILEKREMFSPCFAKFVVAKRTLSLRSIAAWR